MDVFNFAQKAFIVKDGRLLLVKKSADDPRNPNKWEVPGGRMEFGESVDDHLKREVKEEVGLDITVGDPFDIWSWIMNKTNKGAEQIQIVAVARLCDAKTTDVSALGQVEDDFLSEIKWVPLHDVLNYDLIPDMIPVLKRFLNKYHKSGQ